jgi:putative ABC transport system permease protein
MSFWESLRVALSALRANKLRSLLTMLGVIIGVGSVIIMISIVQGARQRVVKDFRGDGTNVVFAFYSPKRDSQHRGKFDGLRLEDVEAIERRVGSVYGVSQSVETQVKATYGKENFASTVEGVTDRYLDVNTIELARGRFITAGDGDDWSKVCVIGDKVRNELFKKEDPIGKEIILVSNGERVPLSVVGFLKYKGKNGFGPSGPDEQIFVPLATVQKRLTGDDKIGSFSARAADNVSTEAAADEVFAVLKQLHPQNAQDIIVDTQEGLLQRLDSVLMIFQLILGGVGGLSLLVGGIGIMNIMLVSVTERTREIGIRKAVGAKQSDILLQFITESMTVSGLGGLIGVAFGYGVSKVISAAAGEKLPTYVPPWAAMLGFGFAVGVGMFFGIYPAFRAARLDPIEALRYE